MGELFEICWETFERKRLPRNFRSLNERPDQRNETRIIRRVQIVKRGQPTVYWMRLWRLQFCCSLNVG